MNFDKTEEYRTEAKKCLRYAERTFDPNTKLGWKRLAAEWLELARLHTHKRFPNRLKDDSNFGKEFEHGTIGTDRV
jgi:hypothetical protein